jgi:alpha-tubulin suppressor-like RCC1 family protein
VWKPLIFTVIALTACTDRGVVGDFTPVAAPDSGPTTPETDGGADGDAPADFRIPVVKTRIASSVYATCGVTSTNGVLCWGDNSYAQLGFDDLSHSPSKVPVAPMGLPQKAIAVTRGPFAQCALLTGEQPRCWGNVGFGLVEGTGEVLLTNITTPTPIGPLSAEIANVAYGPTFGCVLSTAGRVSCWGIGENGALGSGKTDDQQMPRQIVNVDEPLVDLSTSSNSTFACAVKRSGGVVCWGYNEKRELGRADATPFDATPRPVVGLPEKARTVVAARTHACALLESGRVACWGDDAEGQLGSGSAGAPAAPRLVDGIVGATSIFTGLVHTCAIMKDSEVLCWGVDDQGQITGARTDGTTPPSPVRPTRLVPSSFGAVEGTAGVSHTCVITDLRHVRCIGRTDRERLGPGDFTLP